MEPLTESIQDGNMGEANRLMQDAQDLVEARRNEKPLPQLSFDVEKPVGGNTPNKRGLKFAIRFAAARLFGKGNPAGATKDLQAYLDEQQKFGQCCQQGGAIETGSTSHGQLHLAWAALALWALARSKPQDEPSKKLLDSLRNWWKNEMRLMELCRLPASEIGKKPGGPFACMPNWRAWESRQARTEALANGKKPPPSNSCRDICARLIFGFPVPSADKPLWNDRFFLAASLLRELKNEGEELQQLRPSDDLTPPLPFTLHVKRWAGDDFVAWYEVPEDRRVANEPLLTAGFLDGKIVGEVDPEPDLGKTEPPARVDKMPAVS